MIRTIPLDNGQSHFRFRVSLGGIVVRVRVNWLTRYGYYVVDLSSEGEALVNGLGLHPKVDLLQGTSVPGSLYMEGEQPTPNNLNVDNKLRYEESDG